MERRKELQAFSVREKERENSGEVEERGVGEWRSWGRKVTGREGEGEGGREEGKRTWYRVCELGEKTLC